MGDNVNYQEKSWKKHESTTTCVDQELWRPGLTIKGSQGMPNRI